MFIEVWNDETWEYVPIAYEVNRKEIHGICNSLANSSEGHTFRVLEDRQPPVYYARIETKVKTRIIW